MENSVLDSYAVLAFLFREPGYEKVLKLLEEAAIADQTAFMASPNWAEVYYQVERKLGSTKWQEVRSKLLGLPIEVLAVDRDLAESAAALKVTKKMSLADCFCAAVAKEQKAAVYTGGPEFKAVEREIKIVWI